MPTAAALLVQLPVVAVIAAHEAGPRPWAYLAAAAIGSGALALRRRSPGPVVLVSGAAAVAALQVVPGPPVALAPFLIAVVGAIVRGATAWAVVTMVAALLVPLARLVLTGSPASAVPVLAELVLLGAASAAGNGIRLGRLRGEDRRAASRSRRQAAAEQERVAIARELHDVLAHSLSSITVQAGVGLHLADADPAAAREALATIRVTSRTALDEVRQVLGVLRGDEAAPRVPEPGVDEVTRLAQEVAALGVRVRLDDALRPRPPQPVQLAVYRIVQESLTNAVRHAPGAEVEVQLARVGVAVHVRVRDRGGHAAPAAAAAEGPGRGLLGMRERAELLGGTLRIERHHDGFEVAATILAGASAPASPPLQPPAEPPASAPPASPPPGSAPPEPVVPVSGGPR